MKALSLLLRPALKLIALVCFGVGLWYFLICSRFFYSLNVNSVKTGSEENSKTITPIGEGILIQASTDAGTLTARVVPGKKELLIRKISFKSRFASEREFIVQDYFATNLWESAGSQLSKSTGSLYRFDLIVKLMRIRSDGTQELAPKETLKINDLLKGIEFSASH